MQHMKNAKEAQLMYSIIKYTKT